jgi:ketosteroid isomerase-like protein
MRMKGMFGFISIVTLALCLSLPQHATAASDEEEALQVATNFAKAFNNSDFALMASLHWQSPNLSKYTPSKEGAFITQGWDAIGGEWKTIFENPAGTFNLSTHNQQAVVLGKDVAVTIQYMIAIDTDPQTKVQSVSQFRQTLVLQKIGGRWLIIHEHASDLPTK